MKADAVKTQMYKTRCQLQNQMYRTRGIALCLYICLYRPTYIHMFVYIDKHMFVYTVDVHGKQDINYKTRCTKLDVVPYVYIFVYIDLHISICLSIQTNICLSLLWMYMANKISITKLDAPNQLHQTRFIVLCPYICLYRPTYIHMFV